MPVKPIGTKESEFKTNLQGFLFEIAPDIEITDEAAAKLNAEFTFKEPKGLLEIPEAFQENLKALKDSEPMFITAKIRSGFSRFLTLDSVLKQETDVPHRFWPKEVVYNFAKQIRQRQIPGYNGHDAMLEGHKIPSDIPIIWLSAVAAIEKADNTPVVLTRGYVLPKSPMRDYLRAGVVDSFSVYTLAEGEWTKNEDGEDENPVFSVKKAAILSFDPVRKGTEGILGTKLLSTEGAMDPEILKAIAKLTGKELAEINPALFAELSKPVNSQIPADNSELIQKLQKVTMEKIELLEAGAINQKLAELFNCESKKLYETVVSMKSTWEEGLTAITSSELGKIKGTNLRAKIEKSVKAEIAAGKLVNAKQISDYIANEIAVFKETVAELAKENGMGTITANFRFKKTKRLGDIFVSEQTTALESSVEDNEDEDFNGMDEEEAS